MSDLRDEIARAFIRREWDLGPGDDDWNPAPEELAAADAVLRVVGERLTADDVVIAANNAYCETDSPFDALDDFRAALCAAWRVVTGSKDGSDQ